MSIHSALLSAKEKVYNVYSTLSSKGVNVPLVKNLSNLNATIESIKVDKSMYIVKTGNVDRVGLAAIGWATDDIDWLQSIVWWDEDEDDLYKVENRSDYYYKGSDSLYNSAGKKYGVAILDYTSKTTLNSLIRETNLVAARVYVPQGYVSYDALCYSSRFLSRISFVGTPKPSDLNSSFYNTNLDVDFLGTFDLSNCSNMRGVYNATLTKYSDLSNESATNLSEAFRNCAMYGDIRINAGNRCNASKIFHSSRIFGNILFGGFSVTYLDSALREGKFGSVDMSNLDASQVTSLDAFAYKSSIRDLKVPKNIGNATIFSNMFWLCNIDTIYGDIDVNSATNVNDMFKNCTIKHVHIKNLGISISLSDAPYIDRDSLLYLFNNAKSVESGTITLGTTNLAKLTDDEKAIAINKGWTLA